MGIANIFRRIGDRLKEGPFAERDESVQPNLPNGGHTGYHPKYDDRRQWQSNQNSGPYFQQPYAQPQNEFQFNMAQSQQPAPYSQSQFFHQPVDSYTNQVQNTFFSGYQMPGQQSPVYPAAAAPMEPMMQQTPGNKAGFGQMDDGRHRRVDRLGDQPVADNISYMPGGYIRDDHPQAGSVQRLTQPLSAATCYRIIEFMRNGETVIVNTELIRDERENTRCLDLLFGAAFTMNCTFTRISARSIYLIAPPQVNVIAYESMRQMNDQDLAMRWPDFKENKPAQAVGDSFGWSAQPQQEAVGQNRFQAAYTGYSQPLR